MSEDKIGSLGQLAVSKFLATRRRDVGRAAELESWRCFDFAKLIGDRQMEMITDTHSVWVRPKVVTLSPMTAEALANWPADTVWVLGAAAAGRAHWKDWSGKCRARRAARGAARAEAPTTRPGGVLINQTMTLINPFAGRGELMVTW